MSHLAQLVAREPAGECRRLQREDQEANDGGRTEDSRSWRMRLFTMLPAHNDGALLQHA